LTAHCAAAALLVADELHSIDWTWQAADAKTLPAPLGGGLTGPKPTDLGQSGTKRHLVIEGGGVPLSVHLSAANRHDRKGLADLIGEPVYPARRWKAERSISWLNNMRKLRERWEKKAANYRGLWLLAIALV
jgi:hypothetical protein